MLARNQAGVAHELGRLGEALEGADFGDDGDGGQLGHATQSLEGVDERLLYPFGRSRCKRLLAERPTSGA